MQDARTCCSPVTLRGRLVCKYLRLHPSGVGRLIRLSVEDWVLRGDRIGSLINRLGCELLDRKMPQKHTRFPWWDLGMTLVDGRDWPPGWDFLNACWFSVYGVNVELEVWNNCVVWINVKLEVLCIDSLEVHWRKWWLYSSLEITTKNDL